MMTCGSALGAGGGTGGIFREDGVPVEAAGKFVFIENHFVLAGSNIFHAGSVFRVGTYAGGMEVEQVIPFAYTVHTFIVMRAAQDFVDVVFGQAGKHQVQFVIGRECTALVVEGQGIGFREDRIVGRSVGFDVAFGCAGRQDARRQYCQARFDDLFDFHMQNPFLPDARLPFVRKSRIRRVLNI